MGIAYTPASSASIKYDAALGTTPCSARATSAQQDEWTVSLGGHHFLLEGSRAKAEELLKAYGQLYDKAYPVTTKLRQLKSLDCEEARDGTVWAEKVTGTCDWHYRYTNGFWYVSTNPYLSWDKLSPQNYPFYLTELGPYTEVAE